ncbi:peptidylprolyl isomerase [Leucobacter chromiireducens]|uniref:Peptidylprolyl isomerase n=1 Tax=Leucobacter chromiireducens subsp. chromiireducens TaxID=660067 RepID=A0ABS1SR95_9MICO|nr:peptidylprolyl isomerase [Leucobacter chromiireducens]MBL3690674.1 peptidylprolyl isomerase [Leucobacter chromiireducens subsp. chromiireducens]
MLRRLVPATAASALLIVGLTGCTSAQEAARADCTPVMQPGALSNSVVVLGEAGTTPQVKVPEGTDIVSSQRTIVSAPASDGAIAGERSLVGVNMSFFDSKSAKPLYESPALADPQMAPEYLLVAEDMANPLSEAVRCAAEGDRVVLALSPTDSAQLAMQLGATPGESLVGVIDVVSASPLAAQGPVRGLPNGYPAVVTDETGQPGVVLPPREAPKGTSSAVRIAGDGEKVRADQNVIGQVLSVGWDGTVQQNSWTQGLMSFGTEEQVAASGNTFRAQLTGKQVGSQVVIVENEGGSARVVVVDILGVN